MRMTQELCQFQFVMYYISVTFFLTYLFFFSFGVCFGEGEITCHDQTADIQLITVAICFLGERNT